ncbi:hypothetical protein F2Q68_00009274 [Brassica cretica]|uniref:Uncharacterized protein n=1 Tax=Brassica cretica TaxID=69181 RepID=A0A8S9KXJ3_BRACR|nr:hypothetical protein F2Q68_00009274 [Brassica cretica]
MFTRVKRSIHWGMKYQIYEAILQFWNWFDAGCLRWRISACLWKEDAAVVSGYLEEWQLVALMNFRFKGRFRSEFVCVSKAVQVLLKFSGFKFEGSVTEIKGQVLVNERSSVVMIKVKKRITMELVAARIVSIQMKQGCYFWNWFDAACLRWRISGLISSQSQSFVVMAGYSSTAVYKEWKLSKSQGLKMQLWFQDVLKNGGTYEFQRRMVHDEFLQVLVKLRSSGGSDQGQKNDHNGACSSKDCFYINGSRLLCLMLFFTECVESSRKKQKREHVISPERRSQWAKAKQMKTIQVSAGTEFLCGIKVDSFGERVKSGDFLRERTLIEYQWQGAKEMKQVSGFMAQGKEIMEATRSSLCWMSQKGLTGFKVFCEDVLLAETITGWSTVSLVVVKSDWGARKKLRHLVNMQLVQIISVKRSIHWGMKYQIYEAILQFWNWFDAGCLRWRISACLWKEDAAVVSGYLEEWQLVALMNFRFKGRFRSEFVCVSKAVQVLLKFSGFKFEGSVTEIKGQVLVNERSSVVMIKVKKRITMELVAARIVSIQMKQGCYNAWSHQERSRSRNMLCLQEHVMFPEGCVKRKDKSSRSNRFKSDDFLKRKKADKISVIRSQGEETSFWFYGSRKGKQGVCFAGCSSFEHGVYKFKTKAQQAAVTQGCRLEHGQFGGSEIRLGSSEEAATLGGYDISDYG